MANGIRLRRDEEPPGITAKRAEAKAEWSGWLSTLDATQIDALKQFTILDENGGPTIVEYEQSSDKEAPVPDVKMGLEAAQKLLSADTSLNHEWTWWILYNAGGGDAGKQKSAKALEVIKKKFLDERTRGYTNPKTRQYAPGISHEEAVAKWERTAPRFVPIVEVGDQDSVNRLKCFGYYRDFPGYLNHYSLVFDAVSKFMKQHELLLQMNEEVAQEGSTIQPQPTKPKQIKTVDAMVEINKLVGRYFGSKKAREDVRVEKVYDDHTCLKMFIPLTYAAAVKFGWDEWEWANRDRFERVLTKEGEQYDDKWKNSTARGTIYAYIEFYAPVPAWTIRRGGEFDQRSLTNLALEIDADELGNLDPENIPVYDEENRKRTNIGEVRAMILAEPERVDPEEDELPIGRGANVYRTKEEAEEVVRHLDAALAALVVKARTFKRESIKSKALELD